MKDEDMFGLRLAIAALAMQALIPDREAIRSDIGDTPPYAVVANAAVKYADALIAALSIPSAAP